MKKILGSLTKKEASTVVATMPISILVAAGLLAFYLYRKHRADTSRKEA